MRSAKQCMCKDGAPAKVSGYGRAEQIIVEVLIDAGRKARNREREWSKAGATHVSCDTEVAVEIESTLSFPPAETIVAITKVGISAKDCRACCVLTAGRPGSADLGHEH